MAEKASKPSIKMDLTPEQQERVKQATRKKVSSLQFMTEELEERVAPRSPGPENRR